MNCHTFSTGLSSGHLGGSAMMVMLAGTTRRVDMCQPAWSTKRTAWAAGATAAAISARCRFIASVLYQPAETLTHRRHRLRRARCQYPIGLPYVFAMDVPVGRRQHESGSASFGITRRQDQGCALALLWAYRTEDVGGGGTLVTRGAWAGA